MADPQQLMLVKGKCNIEPQDAQSLRLEGESVYNETIYQCDSGTASTTGHTFRFPSISPDPKFQTLNPSDYNQAHGISEQVSATPLFEQNARKINFCNRQANEQGASPLERIDLEISCLDKQNLTPQDKVIYMLIENEKFRKEHGAA